MRLLEWVMGLFGRAEHGSESHQPVIDPVALRDEMTRDDPDFARVLDIQHDALQIVTARGLRDGLAIHREVDFWKQAGRANQQGQQEPQ